MGGRTMTQGTRFAYWRKTTSAASLLRPYSDTGVGSSASDLGLPAVVGPAAASEEQYTKRAGFGVAATAEINPRVVSVVDRSSSKTVFALLAPARCRTT